MSGVTQGVQESMRLARRRSMWLRTADWPLLVRILIGVIGVLALVLVLSTVTNLLTVQGRIRETTGRQFGLLAYSQMVQVGDFLSEYVSLARSIALARRVRDELIAAQIRYRGLPEAEVQRRLLTLDAEWRAANEASLLVRAVIDPTLNRLSWQLNEYQKAFPEYVEIVVADQYGGLVSATRYVPDYYLANEAWWLAAYDGGRGNIYVGQPTYDPNLQTTLVVVAVPAHDDGGKVIGVIRTLVRTDELLKAIQTLRIGNTGVVRLVDATGTVIVGPETEMRQAVPVSWSAVRLEGESNGWSLLKGLQGESLLVGYAPLAAYRSVHLVEVEAINELGWVVYISQMQQEALAPARALLWNSIVLAAVSFLVAFALAYVLARSLAQPISQLVVVAREMTGGNLTVQIPFDRKDEIGELATALREMADQVVMSMNTLEQRVTERTRDLETVIQVSGAMASDLDLDVLLPQMVELVRERFGYYYVGLFLVDDQKEWAVLRAGTGEAGRQMLAQGWRLAIDDQSMVGRCISLNQPQIAQDVGGLPYHFDNPFLPETRSEMTLPLRVQGTVIGALTVQSTRAAAFEQIHVELVQAVANRMASAIRDAQLLRQVQESLEAERRAYARVSREEWQKLLVAISDLGFVEDSRGLVSTARYWDEEMLEAVRQARPVMGKEGNLDALAVPILSHGQVVAVIDAHLPADGGGWTTEYVQLLQTLADQLGIALEGARLYRETQERAARERLTSEITASIRQTLDLNAILQTAAREMGLALDADVVEVRLVTAEDLRSHPEELQA